MTNNAVALDNITLVYASLHVAYDLFYLSYPSRCDRNFKNVTEDSSLFSCLTLVTSGSVLKKEVLASSP